jgi:4-amino-4-deoxy-L-arabinose transferase-like glycosyltransferase
MIPRTEILEGSQPLVRARTPRALACVVLIACAGTITGITPRHPLNSHEILVARSATEMERRGDWLVPYFNGEPRLHKPPLNAWLSALFHAVLGNDPGSVTEVESRTPSLLCAIGLSIVAFYLGCALTGDVRVALLSGAVVASTFGVHRFGACARPEMTYAFFTSLAVVALVRLRKSLDREGPRRSDAVLLWSAVAAAILAKGPFLPAFVILGAVVALLAERKAGSILRMLRPLLALPILGVAALWFVVVAARVPGALDFWRSQMFDRVGDPEAGGVVKHALGFYYLYATPLLAAPWILAVPLALAGRFFRRMRSSPEVALVWWSVVVPAALLSLSAGRHGFYMLPVLASIGALTAWALVRLVDLGAESPRVTRILTAVIAFHAVVAVVAAIGLLVLTLLPPECAPLGLAHDPFSWTVALLSTAALACAIAAAARARHAPVAAAVLLAAAFASCFGIVGTARITSSSERALARDFAHVIARTVPAGGEIVALSTVDAAPVIYYADRVVPSVPLERLGDRCREHPSILVIARRSHLEQGVLSGVPVVVEDAVEDPRVVLSDIKVRSK